MRAHTHLNVNRKQKLFICFFCTCVCLCEWARVRSLESTLRQIDKSFGFRFGGINSQSRPLASVVTRLFSCFEASPTFPPIGKLISAQKQLNELRWRCINQLIKSIDTFKTYIATVVIYLTANPACFHLSICETKTSLNKYINEALRKYRANINSNQFTIHIMPCCGPVGNDEIINRLNLFMPQLASHRCSVPKSMPRKNSNEIPNSLRFFVYFYTRLCVSRNLFHFFFHRQLLLFIYFYSSSFLFAHRNFSFEFILSCAHRHSK